LEYLEREKQRAQSKVSRRQPGQALRSKASRQSEPELAGSEEAASSDAEALVARMVAAGRWPAPELLQQILDAGEAAAEPLLAVLQNNPRTWPEKASLVHAARLVGELRPAAAIPALASIVKRYIDKPEEQATRTLGQFGAAGFEVLLDLFRDPSTEGHRRADIALAARLAAGADPALRARLADVLRPHFEKLIEQARAEQAELESSDGEEDDEDFLDDHGADSFDDEDDDFEDDEFEDDDFEGDLLDENDEDELGDDENEYEDLEDEDHWFEHDDAEDIGASGDDEALEEAAKDLAPTVDEELAYYIGDLADLADPLAVDLINIAFKEKLVDESYIDQEEVDELYDAGGRTPTAETNWLESYQRSYERNTEELDPPVRPTRIKAPIEYELDDRPDEDERESDVPVTAPIRKVGPKLGRNDPCWCGSGKKYKKCHLGKDASQ
jgi:hypothetical protein